MTSPPQKSFALNPAIVETLKHAALVCSSLSAGGLLDEETTTGVILGAFAATYPLLAKTDESPPMRWHRFNKAPATNKDSEAANGADFAVVVLGEDGSARLAIFQAKRSALSKTKSGWRLDVRHTVKDAYGKNSSQMVALEVLGIALMATNKSNKNDQSSYLPTCTDLSWIHYLLYGPGMPVCIALSSMVENLKAERSLSGSSNFFSFNPDESPSFGDILAEVALPSTPKWLTVETKSLFGGLPAWIKMMPVMVGGTDKAWTFFPKNRRAFLPTQDSWRKKEAPAPCNLKLVTGLKKPSPLAS
ncbi:hypothetical protein [Xanthomonas campestris]|uniref:hypothetical protein n=1 Tax=Xanthomonas campestris TaxID=339 RepID=UPI002AD445F4|nr:hypothetical protein [Xanthomonas campestris]MEA0927453.1 hypothetical protein [Xanthomonas campestris pv. campestris]